MVSEQFQSTFRAVLEQFSFENFVCLRYVQKYVEMKQIASDFFLLQETDDNTLMLANKLRKINF